MGKTLLVVRLFAGLFGLGVLPVLGLTEVAGSNLTHPRLSPSFLVGDTYQYTVTGAPNQPVYYAQNGYGETQIGTTDGNGVFVYTEVGQASWVGHYDQTWYVGDEQTGVFSFDVFPAPYARGIDTTNPSLSPNFAAGDTYVYEVLWRTKPARCLRSK